MRQFKNYLKEEYCDNTIPYYWCYNDSLDTQTITNCINYAIENHITLENAVEEHIYDQFNDTFDIYDDVINYYVRKTGRNLTPNLHQKMIDYLRENYPIDYQVKTLLAVSPPEDFVIYFGNNWDDDYIEHQKWLNTEDLTPQEIDDELSHTPLGQLFQTQNYRPHELFDSLKRQSSIFLSSVYEELFDYKTDLSGMQLIALPNSNNWDKIFDLFNNQQGRLNTTTEFGLFNYIHGSGCGLGITLEQPVNLSNMQIAHISLYKQNEPYNYSPTVVYGFTRKQYGDDLL